MAANIERSRNILLGVVAVLAVSILSYLLWGEIQFETARREVKDICDGLKVQDSMTQIQISVGFSPHMSMVMMETGQEDIQTGSIYSDGAADIACSVTFARGRLTQKNFGSGGGGSNVPGAPKEKLKSWAQ